MLDSSMLLNENYALQGSSSVVETEASSPRLKDQNILFIIENDEDKKHEHSSLTITYATVEEASFIIKGSSRNPFTPTVLLVSAQLQNFTDKYLLQIKEQGTQLGIPCILYSENFDLLAKHIASEFEFDDYYSGSLSPSLLKKADFIRKFKSYKIQRNSQNAEIKFDQPQIKMWTMKRAFDIAVSGTLLLMLSPALLLIAFIIKLESRGPIFYISKRAGNGYKIFNFYKFRSMRQGADQELKNLSHKNQYGDAVFFKIENDPRVTKFGSFLRKTSLDEIPQLLNVLLGDMSLVGNRPLPLYEAEKLTKDQIAWRFLAPAGITGLWQITKRGKSEMSEEERIQLDMKYAMNNSFLYDIRILLNTLPALLQKAEV